MTAGSVFVALKNCCNREGDHNQTVRTLLIILGFVNCDGYHATGDECHLNRRWHLGRLTRKRPLQPAQIKRRVQSTRLWYDSQPIRRDANRPGTARPPPG